MFFKKILSTIILSVALFLYCSPPPPVLIEQKTEPKKPETVIDADGNVYTTVQIGNQIWTVENWRSTKYADGTPIPHVADSSEWSDLSTPGFCYHNNTTNADSIALFGALYNWYVVDPESPNNIAPEGWRVPTDDDWNVLADFLGGWGIAGAKMKTTDTTGWASPNEGATNESGFSALPGGNRIHNGKFVLIGKYGHYWSTTEHCVSLAYCRGLYYDNNNLYRRPYANDKREGYSVRLVRDVE